MSQHIRFLYLRDEKSFPVLCIAYLVNKEEGTINYGHATFNPNDKRVLYSPGDRRTVRDVNAPNKIREIVVDRYIFSKVSFERKFLCEIAAGRLVIEKKNIDYIPKDHDTLHSVIRLLIQTLDQDKTLPKRAQKAVKAWLLRERRYLQIEEVINPSLQ